LIRLMRQVVVIGCLEVVVTGYLYRFGAWLMHLFMVQVEVQVGAWLMALDLWYRLFTGCLVQVVTGCLVQVDWYRFTTVYLTVIV
jgi:hypothetical protein